MASPEDAVLTARSTRVRRAKGLARRNSRHEQRRFLIEGVKTLKAALGVPGCIETVFATPEIARQFPDLEELVRETGAWWHLADDEAISLLAGSTTPQGVVAVAGFIDVAATQVLSGPGPILICADVRDPGNAGAIIRVADAGGASGVILAGNSVDPYNDKTVRATVGSLFQIPIAIAPDVLNVIRDAKAAGFTTLAADGQGDTGLYSASGRELSTHKVAWVFGNEAWGLPGDLLELADHVVAIPILGGAESLNLATAAAVCLYARFAQLDPAEGKPAARVD